MSSHQDASSFSSLPRANTRSSKKLADSRWAPGGIEDQMMASNKTINDKMASDKASAKSLASPQRSTDPVEINQIDNEKNKITGDNKKNSNTMLSQPRKGSNNQENPVTTMTKPAPHRLIGPLSEEEKTVKVENPFFNPDKHKGLGSSRWANE